MSEEVKFVKPTPELMQVIASDMRQADVDEVWASNQYTPLEALHEGFKRSELSVVVTVNDEPCVMLGLVVHSALTGSGIPWLLGTNNALNYKRNFFTQVPDVIDAMLDVCPRLFNYVHVENKVSIRWLKRIGFTFDDPIPYGHSGELFHKFYLERQ
jgi:hypothetical protein